MPTQYHCSSCGLQFSVGSFHGEDSDGWFTALYCRHCGASYDLQEPVEQFFEDFSLQRTQRKTREYLLHGPSSTQRVVVMAESPPPMVRCEGCGAEGPLGPPGPITDEPPEGLSGLWRPFGTKAPKAQGKCPRCKQQTVQVGDFWIT